MPRLIALLLCTAMSLGSLPAFAQGQIQTKQYEEGGVYEGMFVDGVRQGRGTYTLPDGFKYTGQWVNGEIQGQGIAQYPNGSLFEGQFTDGKPNGQGTITFADGGSYQGDWVAEKSPAKARRNMPTGRFIPVVSKKPRIMARAS